MKLKHRELRRERLKESGISFTKLQHPSTITKYLLVNQYKEADRLNSLRKENALFYFENLKDDSKFKSLINFSSNYIYPLRYPLFVRNESDIIRYINIFRDNGYDISNPFPNSLPDFFGIPNDSRNARKLSRNLITLPTHHQIRKDDLDKIIHILKNN